MWVAQERKGPSSVLFGREARGVVDVLVINAGVEAGLLLISVGGSDGPASD